MNPFSANVGVRHFFARQFFQMNHEDTKAQNNTAFLATDCTDFHRFSFLLSGSSVKIRDHPWQKQGIFSHRLHRFSQIFISAFRFFRENP